MGQTSSGVDPGTSEDVTSYCSFCENPNCYEEVLPTSSDVPGSTTSADRSRSLTELATKFDSILDKAKSLGLEKLVKPIEETSITLKNLAKPGQSSLNKPEISCNCNQWGPDVIGTRGKWICNTCGDKCQCDKTWYIPSIIEKISYNIDPECLKEKGFNVESITPIAQMRDQKEESTKNNKSIEIQIEISKDQPMPMPPKYPSEPSQSRERMKEMGESGATCPCGCGYFQKGEFKVCPCGCGTIIEIVDDDGEMGKIRAGGPCCVCGNELNDELSDIPRGLSKVSFTIDDAGLMAALEILQAKCRIKDGMIAVLAEELRNSGDINHIIENLGAPCLPRIAIDFDRSMLCEYLRSTSLPDLSQKQNSIQDDTVPKPTNFRVVRSILNSLLVAWDSPQSLCRLRGYEITVNG